jgi:hypothetical protein
MVEFGSSSRSPGYLVRTEWPFWVFDAVPMLSRAKRISTRTHAHPPLGVFLLFAFVYPGQHLPREYLGWYLRTRQLRNTAQSSPPGYHQATAGHAMKARASI